VAVAAAVVVARAAGAHAQQGSVAVHVAVASESAFRLSVRFNGDSGHQALPSISLDSQRGVPAGNPVTIAGMSGISLPGVGALVSNAAGEWALYDTANALLLSSAGPPTLNPDQEGTIQLHVNVTNPNGPAQPCLSNGMPSQPEKKGRC
jgi:hypothetical protein